MYFIMPIEQKNFLFRIITVAILLFGTWGFWLIKIQSASLVVEDGLLIVTFLNIGQGDAIFIETPDGVQILIDGGPDGTVLRELSQVMNWSDHTIDMVIGTHPDKDHIGGLVDVLGRYKIDTILTTENTGETLTAASYHDALLGEGAKVIMARAGQVFALGASTTLAVFSPAQNPSLLDSNTSSIVVQLRYGDIEFMLTGDAPQSIEEYLVGKFGGQLESEVLKLGHHGSKTASAEGWLKTVTPKYAVVSAGKDNRYGHPNPDVVARVEALNILIENTIEQGPITFKSDGSQVWLVE